MSVNIGRTPCSAGIYEAARVSDDDEGFEVAEPEAERNDKHGAHEEEADVAAAASESVGLDEARDAAVSRQATKYCGTGTAVQDSEGLTAARIEADLR